MKHGFTRHLLISSTYQNWRKILEKKTFLKISEIHNNNYIVTRSETLNVKESWMLYVKYGVAKHVPKFEKSFSQEFSFEWNDKSWRLCCKYAIRHCFQSCEACFPFLTTFLYRMTLLFRTVASFLGENLL